MKTLKLKHTLASGGRLMPQQDGAKPGYRNGCMTKRPAMAKTESEVSK